ncbi:hypothetical protein U0070_020961 [Myodes glareolus]|uniref:Uncharacterized protein n=1 Tax=Myodes glareolus TaxID=447135 RepID=A0AAW0IIE3_MYOGA
MWGSAYLGLLGAGIKGVHHYTQDHESFEDWRQFLEYSALYTLKSFRTITMVPVNILADVLRSINNAERRGRHHGPIRPCSRASVPRRDDEAWLRCRAQD